MINGISGIIQVVHRPDRETHKVSARDTFSLQFSAAEKHGKPVLDAQGNPVSKDVMVMAFKEPGPLTPAINPFHKFPKDETLMFLMALSTRDTTYFVGHSGTGKTECVRQVAARLNYNVVQLNFDGHLTRADLIGEYKIISNGNSPEMKFRYGLVPFGFTEPGTILLFDEVDACPPETAFVLQRAISHDLQFLMHETNELFELHPQSCIVGTANTNGQGDDSGLYIAGTNVQNFSFLNRWKTTIAVDYLSAQEETEMLQRMFDGQSTNPKFKDIIASCCAVSSTARAGFKAGTLSVPMTTRDVINWLSKLRKLPYPMKTARYSFLNRMSVQDALTIGEYIQRNFKLPDGDDQKYVKRNAGTGARL